MPSGQQPEKRMRISCKRCQNRKIKCSRTSPCHRCSGAGVHCEFRGDGLKRSPISREYVTGLENKIAALEVFLLDLKSASASDKEEMTASIEFVDHLAPAVASPSGNGSDLEIWNASKRGTWRGDAEGLSGYHGPSSMYNSMILSFPGTASSVPQTPPVSPLFLDNFNLHSPAIRECLANYFHWNQPHSSFIDWDSFLSQYMDSDVSGEHCSPSLVFAMSSLGALMSPKDDIRILADRFFESALTLLKDWGLLTPCLTSIQTLLCCSFFELGKGNVSKGWIYTGVAHSMAQHLGLQRDVKDMGYKIGCTPQDTNSRRRTFVNCFISDKIICLHLGRHVLLHQKDTDIELEEPESASPVWDSWLEQHGLSGPKFRTHPPSISKHQTELVAIIQDMLSQQSSAGKRGTCTDSSQRWMEVSINELNTRFWRWLNVLPASWRWSRWGSNMDPVCPIVAALHMLYHTALISLNRPFLALSQDTRRLSPALAKVASDATSICEASTDIIISIIHRFKAQHGLRVAPFLFVHGTIVAVDATLGIANSSFGSTPPTEDSALSALDAALDDMSYTWEIAGKARRGLGTLLTKRQLGQCRSAPRLSPSQVTESTYSPTEENVNAVYLPFEFPNVGFDIDLLSMLPVGAFDAVDSCYWPVDDMRAEGDDGVESTMVHCPEIHLPNM